MMPIQESTMSSNLQLAFLADRVVNSLSSKKGYTEDDRKIFAKAGKLLEDAISGRQVVETGQLQGRALELLGAYSMALNAYATLAASRNATQKEDIRTVIIELQKDVSDLAAGIPTQDNKRDTIRDFFTFMRDISLKRNETPFDRVNIGSRFLYGSSHNRR